MNDFKNILDNLKERYLGTNWNWLVNKGKSKAGDVTKVEDVEFKKYAKESGTDYGKNPNCWSAPFISGEVKMWF